MRTYKRVRKEGTIEIISGNSEDRIKAIQGVLDKRSYAKIDGTMIDLTSASAIMAVYNNLNDVNKVKFSSLTAYKMADLAYKILSKVGA